MKELTNLKYLLIITALILLSVISFSTDAFSSNLVEEYPNASIDWGKNQITAIGFGVGGFNSADPFKSSYEAAMKNAKERMISVIMMLKDSRGVSLKQFLSNPENMNKLKAWIETLDTKVLKYSDNSVKVILTGTLKDEPNSLEKALGVELQSPN
ncbi:hypothetical protein Thena_0058 [Thermodesulfobium narugense DSM 14796]|uniref:Uncharacterized protein n=1 Tax=Thermodesulfobium narugense DSM 14796 TaxID=747365 RepID=M1E5Q2_9BACT|nr:hypothetical protein [Thermodesulfobium narugense]AEE13710.1 hypothetical protein Thena_0058 [Thermodesulfobium narugense DSM 14796]